MSKYSRDTENLNKYRQDWIDENEKIKNRTYTEWINMYFTECQNWNDIYQLEYDEEKKLVETEIGETYGEPFVLPFVNIRPTNPDTRDGCEYMICLKEYIQSYKKTHNDHKPKILRMTPIKSYVGTKTFKRSDEYSESGENTMDNLETFLNEVPEETMNMLLITNKPCEYNTQQRGKYIRIDGKWIKE